MKTITIVAAVLATSLATATPAGAQSQTGRAIAVPYADLDLGSPGGQRALDLRITHAVNSACWEPSSADLKGQNAVRLCRLALRAEAAQRRAAALALQRAGASRSLAARR